MSIVLGPRAKGVLIPSSKTVCPNCEASPGENWKPETDSFGIKRYLCPDCGEAYCRKPNLPPRRAYKDTRAMGLVCGECRYWTETEESTDEEKTCAIFRTQTQAHFACSVFERPIE